MDITVVGLGYVGLPTALLLARGGYEVLGVDISDEHLKNIETGTIFFDEEIWKQILHDAIIDHKFKLSKQILKSDTYIIAVPTPVKDKELDLTYVMRVVEELSDVIEKGNTIILESTVTPGTTIKIGEYIHKKTNLVPGEDFYLAHVPETVIPGNTYYELINNNRIIGGINEESSSQVLKIYSAFVKGDITLTGLEYAEISKVIENTYRDLNIAFANEILVLSKKLQLDPWKIIENANKHPRVNLLKPGIGVGGHCIPVDPWFLYQIQPEEANLIRTARDRNDGMPQKVADDIVIILNNLEGNKVTILGCSYKPDSNDDRESPVYEVIESLNMINNDVKLYDPYVKGSKRYTVEDNLNIALEDTNLIVLAVAHQEFINLDPFTLGRITNCRIIFDCTNTLDKHKFEKNGFQIITFGTVFEKGKSKNEYSITNQ
jgi:UDP-N-acetyl-D-mannosaminuronic acid dehydrogenase